VWESGGYIRPKYGFLFSIQLLRSRVGLAMHYHLRIQGTRTWSFPHRSMVAVCRSVFVKAAQRSSWFPEEPHLKHR